MARTPFDERRFRCEALHCDLRVATCVERQDARRRGNPVHPFCASGACRQGARNRKQAPAAWAPRPYHENRSDLAAQDRARRAVALVTPPSTSTLDNPPFPPLLEGVGRKKRLSMKPAKRTCAGGCGKKLWASSKGDHCYRCRVKLGLTEPAHLPDPATLPPEYLAKCVAVVLERLGKAA